MDGDVNGDEKIYGYCIRFQSIIRAITRRNIFHLCMMYTLTLQGGPHAMLFTESQCTNSHIFAGNLRNMCICALRFCKELSMWSPLRSQMCTSYTNE